MAVIRHSTTAAGTNNPNKQVSVVAWNDDHVLSGTADSVLGFDAGGIAAELTGGTDVSISGGQISSTLRDALAASTGSLLVGGSAQPVANRTALAALNGAVNPTALLREAGREGTFVFDSSNLSAKVAADTQQGIYVAPASDTTGASGAWVRKLPDGVPNVLHFGVKGDGTTDDKTALQAAFTAISALGFRRAKVPGLTYNLASTLTISASNLSIDAKGAKFTTAASASAAQLAISGNFINIDGLTLYLSDTGGSVYNMNIAGTDFSLVNSTLTGATIAAAGGIQAFIRSGADRCTFLNVSLTNRNGVQVESNDFLWVGGRCESGGGDDAIAVKANVGECRNGRVVGVHFKNHVSFLSIGTQIGTQGANDSTYSKGVYNWSMTGCTGENCGSIALLKVGTSQVTDYRDGTIDGITISDCVLNDPSGSKVRALLWLTAARGGRIRNIRMDNCIMRGRAPDQTQTNAAVLVQGYDYTGGTAATRIEKISVNNCSSVDPYDGVVNGVSAPGYPMDYAFYIENNTGSGGTTPVMGEFEFNGFKLNGCARNAVFVNASLTGPFRFDNCTFDNFCNDASASGVRRGGIWNGSPVYVHNTRLSAGSAAPATTRAVMGDSQTDKTIPIYGESRQCRIGTVTAGNLFADILFEALKDCFIHKIEIVTTAAVTQSDTNYTTITIVNRSTGGNVVSVNTKVTGGLAISAFTPTSLNGTTLFSGANAYLPKGGVLSISNGNTGTGTALTGMSFIVHYVECGN